MSATKGLYKEMIPYLNLIVLEFLILVAEELGFEWINPKLLRIGASSLLIDIERQLYHYTSGRYANKEKLAIG